MNKIDEWCNWDDNTRQSQLNHMSWNHNIKLPIIVRNWLMKYEKNVLRKLKLNKIRYGQSRYKN